MTYNPDNTIAAVTPNNPHAPARVTKAIVKDLDTFVPPEHFIVPMIGAVQDRACVEVLRGCVRGCRFCQAGQIYRPFRERSPQLISDAARALCQNTGYDELSLTSLSTSDHSRLEEVLDRLNAWAEADHVSLSLPSLRVDNFSQSLVEKTTKVRKSGLTFAAEAGTQRLRDVINKKRHLGADRAHLHHRVQGRLHLGQALFHDGPAHRDDGGHQGHCRHRPEGGGPVLQPGPCQGPGCAGDLQRGLLCPQTGNPLPVLCPGSPRDTAGKAKISAQLCPFPQDQGQLPRQRHQRAGGGSLPRETRRLGKVIETAYRNGAFFDTWEEYFDYDRWLAAFAACGVDPDYYNYRPIALDQITPWDHLDVGVSKAFLIREYQKALRAETTQPCNRQCNGCGANKLLGGPCFDYSKNLV